MAAPDAPTSAGTARTPSRAPNAGPPPAETLDRRPLSRAWPACWLPDGGHADHRASAWPSSAIPYVMGWAGVVTVGTRRFLAAHDNRRRGDRGHHRGPHDPRRP